MTRAPVETIVAPAFLPHLEWLGSKPLHMHLLVREGPVLIEFWDLCRPNSIRTLPYLRAWHERYGGEPSPGSEGRLTVIGIHSPGFPAGADRRAVEAAVRRLEIDYPVLLDGELEMWREYENEGWPARYLFDGRGRLFEYHYGEGDYAGTERAIQELLGVQRDPVAHIRPEDAPGALVRVPSAERKGPYSGRYAAGGVWLVLDGSGSVRALSAPLSAGTASEPLVRRLSVSEPGAYPLFEHARHSERVLELELSAGVTCQATCFTPGIA